MCSDLLCVLIISYLLVGAGGYGSTAIGSTLFVNAAVDDTEQAFVFDLPVSSNS
jgi:hypothetical protein